MNDLFFISIWTIAVVSTIYLLVCQPWHRCEICKKLTWKGSQERQIDWKRYRYNIDGESFGTSRYRTVYAHEECIVKFGRVEKWEKLK